MEAQENTHMQLNEIIKQFSTWKVNSQNRNIEENPSQNKDGTEKLNKAIFKQKASQVEWIKQKTRISRLDDKVEQDSLSKGCKIKKKKTQQEWNTQEMWDKM